MEILQLMSVGLILRLGLILYGEWQDKTMAVKFTDVDYFVFHDAARFLYEGKSPYRRATYRYTPLLAWMLQPNIWLSPLFGKLLFILLDCFTGFIIFKITSARKNVSNKQSLICASLWLFNPLPMTVSSRGNAESVMTCLVLLCLQCLLSGKTLLTGAVFSLAVHFKIYPVTYALPIYLWLWDKNLGEKKTSVKGLGGAIYRALYPTIDRICFIASSASILISLTAVFYYIYGWEFLYHTYLYHVTRKDIRHNFSPYFYMLYLQSGVEDSVVLGLVAFIPQIVLLLVFSVKFYKEPNLVFLLNTFAFVIFNKVCTSQYFLWYLCLLPGLVPNLNKISISKAVILFSLWFVGQGLWLLPAYYLEFQGQNSFMYIWLAGLVFFCINCYILYEIIDNYVPYQLKNSKSHETISMVMRNTQQSETNTSTPSRKSKLKHRTSDSVVGVMKKEMPNKDNVSGVTSSSAPMTRSRKREMNRK